MKLKKLTAVKGVGGDDFKMTSAAAPDIRRDTGYAVVRFDDEMAEWVYLLGNDNDAIKLARQCRAKQRVYPFASFPELLALIWLDARGIPYEFQEYVLGGRNRVGGVVPDILIPYGAGYMVWSIIGIYWHQSAYQSDSADRVVTLASTVNGLPVIEFVVIVEEDIYQKWDEVLTAAYSGIEWTRVV